MLGGHFSPSKPYDKLSSSFLPSKQVLQISRSFSCEINLFNNLVGGQVFNTLEKRLNKRFDRRLPAFLENYDRPTGLTGHRVVSLPITENRKHGIKNDTTPLESMHAHKPARNQE